LDKEYDMNKGFDSKMLGTVMMNATPSSLDNVIASKGRGADSMIAHISPREAAILKALGGSGRVNPRTGFLEFDDSDSGGDSGSGNGADSGGGTGGQGDSDSEGNSSSEGGGVGGGVDSETNADLGAMLGDMEETAAHNANIGNFSLSEPSTYGPALSSLGTNLGKGFSAGMDNFSNDPMGYISEALTPSPETVGAIIGALSPMPFGSLFGAYIGSQFGKGVPSAPGIDMAGEMSNGRADGEYQGELAAAFPQQSLATLSQPMVIRKRK
jgi:hypothetical protein